MIFNLSGGSSGGSGGDTTSFKGVIERTATNPTLPSNLTSIAPYAFTQYSNLALTSLPSGVTSIGNNAFYNCSNLALTSLPSGVTSISDYAFYKCSSLALTSLPSGVTSIGTYAFQNCSNLALTSLPSGLTSIGTYAFQGCSALAITSIPSGVTTINAYAFQNSSIALTSLPSTVTGIGNYAFQYCRGIGPVFSTDATFSGGFGTMCFAQYTSTGYQPSALTELHMPNNIGSLVSGQFQGNRLLELADVGSPTSIAANAFSYCFKLQTLILRRTSAVVSLSNVSAFNNTPMSGYNSLTGTVYVPSALISTYQTASNWKTLYDNGTVTFSAIEGSQYEI